MALTCLAFWGVLALDSASLATFALAWAVDHRHHMDSRTRPRQAARGACPQWGKAEARTFVLLLAIVPAVFVFPYKNLGAQDAQGNRFYRAYFTADFIWHTALTAELMKYDMPPINPYLGDRTIQYYWTYFLVPAVIAQEGPAALNDVELVLKVNALLLRRAVSRRVDSRDMERVAIDAGERRSPSCWACWPSAPKGCTWRGFSSSAADRSSFSSTYNIDAISAWRFNGLRVDSLVRSMWYNPHHSMSAALGIARHAGGRCRRSGGAARCDRPGWARAGALHDLQSPGRRSLLAGVWGRHSRRRAARASVARSACLTRLQQRPSAQRCCGASPTIWSKALRTS